MNLASVSFGARISWLKEMPKDVLMTVLRFLGMAIGVVFDHHLNLPSA
jgi:hypothetical protein